MEKENMFDLTTGSIAKKLYRFALPIIITNLLQAVYSLVDMMIVGRFVGPSGMVAVSVGGQITAIVFAIIMALANAESALVGQLLGKKNFEGINKLLHTMLTFTIVLAAIIIVVIIVFSGPILTALQVPEEAFVQTRQYLIIYILGTFFVYIYNDLYGMVRGAGVSFAPMLFVLLTTIINLVLDVIMVGPLQMDTAGAALATVCSQFLNMLFLLLYIKKKKLFFVFDVKLLKIAKEWLSPLLKIGLPQALQFSLTSFSFVLIASLINSFGVNPAAATGAVDRLYNIAVLPSQAMMAAIITFTAQNLPGKNYKRIRMGIFFGALLAVIIAGACLLVCELAPAFALGLFTEEAAVIEIGIRYLRIFAILFVIEAVMFTFYGALTGAGHTHITFSCALITAFVVRCIFSWGLCLGTDLGFYGIAVAYVLAPCVGVLISGLYLLSGKWKKSRVKI